MKQSIAGIVFLDGKFLIGQRLPRGQMGGRWEFLGGKVEEGETPEQAIVREFAEELGVTAIPRELITIKQFSNNTGASDLLAYHVEIPDHSHLSLSEHSAVSWVTLDQIEKLDFVDSDRLLLPALQDWIRTQF